MMSPFKRSPVDDRHEIALLPAGTKSFPSQRRVFGTSDILFAFAVISVPLAVFSAALIGIVLGFRVQHSAASMPTLGTEEYEPGVYYVRISSTTFVLLASFSSSIVPTIIGFVMFL